MTFQAVPDTIQTEIIFSCPGGIVSENILYWKKSGYIEDDVEELAIAIDSWCGTVWRELVASNVLYLRTEAKGLASITDSQFIKNTGSGVGAQPATELPNEVAFVVSFRSAFTGRSARGRIYLPPPSAEDMDDTNHVTAMYADAASSAYDTLRSDMAVAGFTQVIVSRYTLGAKRPVAVTFDVQNALYTDLLVDSQRGRKPASG